MTESEWHSCKDLCFMLEQARSDRKRLLFGVACCRRIWHLLPDEHCRRAVVLAEQMAQGYVGTRAAGAALALTRRTLPGDEESAVGQAAAAVRALLLGNDWSLYAASNSASASAAALLRSGCVLEEEISAQAALLRDILGNPFAPVRITPAWLTWNRGAVVALAEAIYDESAFDQTPILADALEEAGCTVAAILDHLRGPGPHVLGCWVVDLLLGKI